MVQQAKRKRGRPRKDAVQLQAEGESPLWAIVDQLTLIRDELHALNKMCAASKAASDVVPVPYKLRSATGPWVNHG